MGPRLKKPRNPFELNKEIAAAPPADTSVALPVGPPKVSFADVETRLDMHQFNGFFEALSPERQNNGDTSRGAADLLVDINWNLFLKYFLPYIMLQREWR